MANYLMELEQDALAYGLTLYDLCEKSDVAASNVPRWKKQETTPNLSTLQKLRESLEKISKVNPKKRRSP